MKILLLVLIIAGAGCHSQPHRRYDPEKIRPGLDLVMNDPILYRRMEIITQRENGKWIR